VRRQWRRKVVTTARRRNLDAKREIERGDTKREIERKIQYRQIYGGATHLKRRGK